MPRCSEADRGTCDAYTVRRSGAAASRAAREAATGSQPQSTQQQARGGRAGVASRGRSARRLGRQVSTASQQERRMKARIAGGQACSSGATCVLGPAGASAAFLHAAAAAATLHATSRAASCRSCRAPTVAESCTVARCWRLSAPSAPREQHALADGGQQSSCAWLLPRCELLALQFSAALGWRMRATRYVRARSSFRRRAGCVCSAPQCSGRAAARRAWFTRRAARAPHHTKQSSHTGKGVHVQHEEGRKRRATASPPGLRR